RDNGKASRATPRPGGAVAPGNPSADLLQRAALVHGDVVGPVALDLVLRLVPAGMAGVALVLRIAGVDPGDPAADVTGLGVPADVVADLEFMGHGGFLAAGVSKYRSARGKAASSQPRPRPNPATPAAGSAGRCRSCRA